MNQQATRLIELLRDHRLRLFHTSDILTLTGMNRPAAVQALRRLATRQLVARLKRGLWVNRLVEDLDPMEAIPHLVSPWPGYVSLTSALSRQGIIEEVPHVIYAVTAGRPATYRTVLGEYHVHHLPERLMWGFKSVGTGKASLAMAEPEKAFLDLVYLGLVPRSPIGLPYKRDRAWRLDRATLKRYAHRFKHPPLTRYLRQEHML